MLSERVQNLIPKIQEFMCGQSIKRAWLFGSCSRGEEARDSDINLCKSTGKSMLNSPQNTISPMKNTLHRIHEKIQCRQ